MGFFGYSEATNPCERAVTKMIKLPNISEDTRVLLGQIQKGIDRMKAEMLAKKEKEGRPVFAPVVQNPVNERAAEKA